MPESSPQIQVVVSPPFMENTWIVGRPGRPDCVVIDPGFTPREVISLLDSQELTPAAILITHGHVDHIAGNTALRRRWPEVPILIGAGDAIMLTDARANLSLSSGVAVTSPPADRLLHESDLVEMAGLEFEVRNLPGHSPGHIVYLLRDAAPPLVFGGDVLFRGSVGRTDLPGGSHRQLITGIRQKLLCLSDDTIVYPGHGERTSIGEERHTNPYFALRD